MLPSLDSCSAYSKIAAALVTTSSTGFLTSFFLSAEALAQTAGPGGSADPSASQVIINRDAATGAVTVNRNAYTLETGPLLNTSNIPLPAFVPSQTAVGQSIETVTDGTLAPSSVIFGTDLDYIRENFGDAIRRNPNSPLGNRNASYTFEEGSISITTEISLERAVGDHQYGEGIELSVLDENSRVIPDAVITDSRGRSVDRIFVRGDGVTVGPDGQVLNSSEVLTVTYRENERVTLKLLNLRDNNTAASESGAYFTADGRLIAEDFQDGGDRDFNDGDYLNFRIGRGQAQAVTEETNVEITTERDEQAAAPEIRREEIVVDLPAETLEVSEDVIDESRVYGSVGLADYQVTRLGHATGVRIDNQEGGQNNNQGQTVYSRYADASQVRAGSDGLSATGQLTPLNPNPSAPPTLLTGELTFNPFVGDNEAGFIASAGITQFINSTHRSATDLYGNPIATAAGPRLLEPTGWLNNREMVGYVPAAIEIDVHQTDAENRLLSIDGIFNIPKSQAIVIAPPDPRSVGRGASAYTDNVGGLLIKGSDGTLSFEPQWTHAGYAQTPQTFAAGEAAQIIYALVPQQPGQALQLGTRYPVEERAGTYRIVEGGFRVIAADQEPQNFLQESSTVYAVEDTLLGINAATSVFNGLRGEYLEPSGDRATTLDLFDPGEVDARIGNQIYPAPTLGQQPYAKTTRAAGLYVSGTFTGGIGNQRDRVTRRTMTLTTETDQIRTQRTTNIFSTPLTQVSQVTREETATAITRGDATFDINSQGLLENAVFSPSSTTLSDAAVRIIDADTTLQRGEEILTDSITTESQQILDTRTTEVAGDATNGTDSYANATPLQGEFAFGSILNFGNTPWTAAANTLRGEVFFRETLLGRGTDSESGWRAALTMHPFGETQRAAHQYDTETGDWVPVYQTEPVREASGQPRMEKVATADGRVVEVAVNRFVRDEAGDRIPAMVGTGRSRGPGLYVRVQDTWNNSDSLTVDGGIQFSF